MCKDLVDDHRVFDTSNDFNGAAAFTARLDTDVASGRLLSVKTRLIRCAQVIAMDGMYAGFAGAKNRSSKPDAQGKTSDIAGRVTKLIFRVAGRQGFAR